MRTPDIPAGSVVVGTDGSEHSDRAVVWAAEQAALENRTLVVLHSVERVTARDTAWLDVQGIDHRELVRSLALAAEAVLEEAETLARGAAGGVEVVGELVHEDAREALLDASEHAHLVVVGSRGRGPLRSLVLGSVSSSVVRHARCPVVVCRPGGMPRDHEGRASHGARGVLVGADGTGASAPVIEFAFEQASLRGVPLTVMHCFYDVAAATLGTPRVVADDEELGDLRLLLAESVAGLREKYPDVEVDLQLARGLVDDCLVDEAPSMELVVVGRARPTGLDRFLHASCALAVTERARTTVAVVPESEGSASDSAREERRS